MMVVNLSGLGLVGLGMMLAGVSKYVLFSLGSLLLMVLVLHEYGFDTSILTSGGYIDGVGSNLVMLSILVTLLMFYSSHKVMRWGEYDIFFYALMYFLMVLLMVVFYVGDYLLFYFFFEVSLIPTLMIIVGWGYQPERVQAGVYFLFYTLFASLPLLLMILWLYEEWGGLSFVLAGMGEQIFYDGVGEMLFIGVVMSLAFLVKLPMFFTHLWLPKAHVEAPVAGSMILAGVLLKLGGYGVIRVGLAVSEAMSSISYFLIGLSLFGMLFVGLVCCRLNDFKALVAYSSVSHMGMVIGGLFTFYLWGLEGALLMMIGHGISSSGLFCMVNMYYERSGSRSFYVNKGLLLLAPLFSLFLFMLSAANIAAPPTVNLLSEIYLMASIMGYDMSMVLVFPVGSFLGAVFTIFMYSYSQHGMSYYLLYGDSLSNLREFHVLGIHVVAVNFLILKSLMFLTM